MLGVMILVVLILMMFSVPIAISLGIGTMVPYVMAGGAFPFDATMFIRSSLSGLDSTITIAIPLFVLSGIIMAKGRISEKIFNIFEFFIGKLPGGLPCAVVVTCLFYGAISGSAPATTAAVGAMTIPLLTSLGYDLTFSAALVATAGGLGVIIPPSIPFILYSSVSPASIGDLFIAGIVPGLLIGAALMVTAVFLCKKHGEDRPKIDAHCDALRQKGFFTVFLDSFWALLSPVIILGGIYGGFFTPTEAAAVSVVYSLIISLFVYRSLRLRDLWNVFAEAVTTYAPILFIIATASAFGRVLTMTQAPQLIATTLGNAFPNKIALLIVINLFLLVVGMFMDTTPAILILAPILVPIAVNVGINPVHFGIMMVCNLAVGFITPPIGNNLYVASTLTKVPVLTMAKKVLPFMAAFLIILVAIIFIPQISLVLVGA